MSLSEKQRLDNVDLALSLFLKAADGKWFIHAFFNGEDPIFSDILSTTWDELQRRHYIATALRDSFVFTEYGWRIALEKANKKSEFNEQLGRLCASLKKQVDGRTQQAATTVEDLARDTGLSDYFIRNVIDSDLIGHWLNRHGAKWADPRFRGKLIVVPIGFGHTILT